MLKWLSWTLTTVLAQTPGNGPFWQAKPKYYERIQAREILVNVTGEEHHLKIVGGGQVKADCDTVFKMTDRAPQLLKNSSYVSKVDFDPKTHHLKLGLKAYEHSAEVEMELKPQPENKPQTLDVKMLSGPMSGFSGTLTFYPQNAKCDVGFGGEYTYDHFTLPKLFLEFGLEVVMQKLAWSSRDVLETEIKGQK